MKKIKKLKPYGITALLALVTLLLILCTTKVYPFGDHAFMWTDGNQYFSFERYFGSISGKNDIFYTWGNVLGGNALSQLAYYAFSPFNVLYIFLIDHMMFAAHVVTYTKIILSSITFFYCLDYLHKDHSYLMKSALSVCYSFMGYMIFNGWNASWMDGIILLPVMYIGIIKILEGKNPLQYIIALSLAIISNFYIGYMLCIGSFIFYIALSVLHDEPFWKGIKRTFLPYACSSLIGAALSAFVLLPAYFGVPSTRKMTLIDILKDMHLQCKPVTILSGLFTGQINSLDLNDPLIYVGIFPLVLVVLLFVCKKAPVRKKIVYAALMLIFAVSFANSSFNTIWHGMSKNSWFNYRYSFLLSCVLLLAAYEAYSLVLAHETGKPEYIMTGLILLIITSSVMIFAGSKVRPLAICVDVFLICAVLALLFGGYQGKRLFTAFIILETIFCSALNGYLFLKDRAFYSVEQYGYLKSVMSRARECFDDDSFYRMEKTIRFGRCDANLFDYSGVTNYASTENLSNLEFLKRLGIIHQWMWGEYTINMPEASESLLGIKYLLTNSINSKDYINIGSIEDVQVFKNPHALPLLFPVQTSVVNTEGMDDYDLQNAIWKSLNGIDKNVFESNTITSISGDNAKVLEIAVNKGGSVYMIIPRGPLSDVKAQGDSIDKEIDYLKSSEIYYIGDFSEGEMFDLVLTVDDSEYDLNDIICFTENKSVIEENSSLINEYDMNIEEISSSHIEMSYNGKRKFISTTIPYDEGWTVYDNGNKVKLQKNWSNFISFELDDTDDHHIKLIYRPNGFYTGAAVSLSALLLVVLYMVFRKVRISRGSF